MNKLIEGLDSTLGSVLDNNLTLTENYALTNKSTLDKVLDFFSKSGALRGRPEEFVSKFAEAWNDGSPLYALRALYQARDIRGGNGERDNFRYSLLFLAEYAPDVLAHNRHLVPEYGRWDDLWPLLDSPLKKNVLELIKAQLYQDMESMNEKEPISLLAKWLPSENTSSRTTRRLAKTVRFYLFGKNAKLYRRTLSKMRSYIDVVERKMSANRWEGIKYDHVPSQAMQIYRRAFEKHDPDGFGSYLTLVESGEAEIKAATLDPHQLVSKYLGGYGVKTDRVVEAQWKALPNYMDEKNMVVVADTSGSMSGKPLEVSVSLALYAAERNTGPFSRRWLNFSNQPTWQKIEGETLLEKVQNIDYSNWQASTNVEAVFNKILETAVRFKAPETDMPKIIIIISDMQFNYGAGGFHFTTHETIKAKYRRAGYDVPLLVYWNVRSSFGQPVTKDDIGTILVSGFSTGVFKTLMAADTERLVNMSPLNYMIDVLDGERYQPISMPE